MYKISPLLAAVDHAQLLLSTALHSLDGDMIGGGTWGSIGEQEGKSYCLSEVCTQFYPLTQ